MSDYHLGGGLRTVHPTPLGGGQPGRQLLHRVAKRGGQQVVAIRCFETAHGYDVECDVNPVGSLNSEPVRKGPYSFASEAEAHQFADEATLALQYLGCEVSETAAS